MAYLLVIDDNKQTSDALVQMLKLWDLSARAVQDAESAKLIIDFELPRAVFLDLNMPGLTGFDVLAYMKSKKTLESIPVIIVTSDDQPQTYKRALDGGASEVIIKPVLMDVLEKFLKKSNII